MLTLLLIVLTVVVFIQPTAQRMAVAGLFAFSAYGFDLLSQYMQFGGDTYYLIGSLFDLSVLIGIMCIKNIPYLGVQLARISLLSIGLNLFGWMMWYKGIYGLVYEWSFIVLYGYAIYDMISTESHHGNHKNHKHITRVHPDFTKRI